MASFKSAHRSLSAQYIAQTASCYLAHLLIISMGMYLASSTTLDSSTNQVLQFNLSINALSTLNSDQLAVESAQFQAQVLKSVPDLVPPEVKCTKIQHCDKKGVCAIVCQHGSVQVDQWLQKALRLQRKLAYRRNLCSASLLGTHNSAISMADGYGVEDHVFEGYLHYFSWFKKGMTVHTNDQFFSLTDQLQMGVRFIELDVHWFDGDLHIAHCGGFKSKLLDSMIEVFNDVAKLLGTGIEWDSGTIGCKPSLSSIPTKEQRPLKEALSELSTWLHAPEHQDEFLMVFFDDETDLMRWKKVGKLLDYLKQFFLENEILRPIDLVYQSKWPTIEELLLVGKRVMFMSGVDYLNIGEEILFVKDSICNWQEPILPISPFPDCRFHGSESNFGIFDENFTILRPETSEIEYGFLNAAGEIGINQNLLDESTLPGVVDCGVNLPSPDNLTPNRIKATIWVVSDGKELHPSECVALLRNAKTWQSVDCNTANLVPACVNISNPRNWQLGSMSVLEAEAVAACAALHLEMEYSAPASGFENELLYKQLMEHDVTFAAGVWLNAKTFVSEVYSTEQNENLPSVHHTAPLSYVDDTIAVE
ncbi:putative PLC-like phosphodiesterase, TIM beta/alpha-barrel domain superfamily [Plasmopara halstedii]